MNCRELAEFLMDYVSNELPAEARDPFEVHLSRCPNCLEYVRQYRVTIVAERRAFNCDEDLPEVPEELIQAILLARKGL